MHPRIPRTVVHYSTHDPRKRVGGVETFARNLALVFEDVVFMTPDDRDFERVRRERLPVICDNHTVLDWPLDVPAIGFQHGVSARKMLLTRSYRDGRRAWLQWRAARRPNTLWVACARWIQEAFGRLHGNRARHVIYHPIDLDRFDGRLTGRDSRLVLHDARTPNKGSRVVAYLARALPEWSFEPLACRSDQVAERMRGARGFLHLSRYEGNSIVCLEAMAMDLPCLFSRVGLMLDDAGCDVEVVPAADLRRPARLVKPVRAFLEAIGERPRAPREWVLRHASFEVAIERWRLVIDDFDRMRGC